LRLQPGVGFVDGDETRDIDSRDPVLGRATGEDFGVINAVLVEVGAELELRAARGRGLFGRGGTHQRDLCRNR